MEIWIEKKRPKNFDEIIGQDAIVRRIKAMVDNKSVPHLLFTGPAGSGKCVCSNTPILDYVESEYKKQYIEEEKLKELIKKNYNLEYKY